MACVLSKDLLCVRFMGFPAHVEAGFLPIMATL